ncbi:MAG: DUF5683 domain-containing protein, partial [Calditrichia bacterium]
MIYKIADNYSSSIRNSFPAIILIFGLMLSLFPSKVDGGVDRAKEDQAVLDTVKLLSDQPLKSPTGAVLRSAVLPGWGQAYNEQYLKGVFSLALNASLLATILYNNHKYKETGDSSYKNRRQDFSWLLGIAYLLNLVDAYVNAYLYKFDDAIELAAF